MLTRFTLLMFTAFAFSFSFFEASAQCPANAADLADGGTFSGDCTINSGGNVLTITGNVTWTSGRLTIDGGGNDGDVTLNGGTFTIQNGATLDLDDGEMNINAGASMNVDAGGSLEMENGGSDLVVNGGTLVMNGTLLVDRDVDILNSANVTFGTGSTITIGDDLDIDNATLTIDGSGSIGDNLRATNGANVTIDSNADIDVFDFVSIDDSDMIINGAIQSTDNNDLFLEGNSNLTINDPANVTFTDLEVEDDGGTATIIVNGGTLTLTDEIDFNNSTDNDAIIINGGTVDVQGDIDIGGTSNTTITVNGGGTLLAESVDGVAVTDPADLPVNIDIVGGVFESNGVSLPVELTHFSGSLIEDDQVVLIEWVTLSELDNFGFYVERSIDGKVFEEIGFVDGNGTSIIEKTYQFIDDQMIISSYYRLRQVDFDGAFELSHLIYVSSIIEVETAIELYPNPMSDVVRLGGMVDELYTVELYNQSGKRLFFIEKISLLNFESTLNSVLQREGSGLFLLKFSNPGHSEVIRLVKQ